MHKNLKTHYDDLYAKKDNVFGMGKPSDIVAHVPNYISGGTVFDIGAGEGRNSLFLAHKGFVVEAVDISEKGIEKLRTLAEKESLHIDAHVGDIQEEQITKNYDVIVSSFMLHHLNTDSSRTLIRQMQEHTNEGGLNVISTFTKEGDFYKKDPTTKRFYPALGELEEIYRGWDILEYTEEKGRAHATHDDGSPMFNVASEMIAKKKIL